MQSLHATKLFCHVIVASSCQFVFHSHVDSTFAAADYDPPSSHQPMCSYSITRTNLSKDDWWKVTNNRTGACLGLSHDWRKHGVTGGRLNIALSVNASNKDEPNQDWRCLKVLLNPDPFFTTLRTPQESFGCLKYLAWLLHGHCHLLIQAAWFCPNEAPPPSTPKWSSWGQGWGGQGSPRPSSNLGSSVHAWEAGVGHVLVVRNSSKRDPNLGKLWDRELSIQKLNSRLICCSGCFGFEHSIFCP